MRVLVAVLVLLLAVPARAGGACDPDGRPTPGATVLTTPDGSASIVTSSDPTAFGETLALVTDRGYVEAQAGPGEVRVHGAFHEDSGDIANADLMVSPTPVICVGQGDQKVVNEP